MDGAKEKRPLTEHFERVWTQALMTVSTAEDEAAKVLQRVAEVAGWSQDEVKRHAREVTERLTTQRRELERNFDENVRKTLARLKVPRRDEILELEARIERLTERLNQQLDAGSGKQESTH